MEESKVYLFCMLFFIILASRGRQLKFIGQMPSASYLISKNFHDDFVSLANEHAASLGFTVWSAPCLSMLILKWQDGDGESAELHKGISLSRVWRQGGYVRLLRPSESPPSFGVVFGVFSNSDVWWP